jgi:hypothetical protein
MLQQALAADPGMSEAQKSAITQWVAVAVGATFGGQTGAAAALDNINYNYLTHAEVDTLTDPKLANSAQIYSSVKSYIDAAASFEKYRLLGIMLEASQISARRLELAIPQAATAAQWQQLQKAVEYGASKGVTVNITGIR